jgi:hypothetical protein
MTVYPEIAKPTNRNPVSLAPASLKPGFLLRWRAAAQFTDVAGQMARRAISVVPMEDSQSCPTLGGHPAGRLHLQISTARDRNMGDSKNDAWNEGDIVIHPKPNKQEI